MSSPLKDLAISFGKFARGVVEHIMPPDVKKLSDRALLREIAYDCHAQFSYINVSRYGTLGLAKEVERRVLADESNHSLLVPYAKALAKVPYSNCDDPYSTQEAMKDLSRGIFEREFQTPLQKKYG